MQSKLNTKIQPQTEFPLLFIYFALAASVLLIYWQVGTFDFINFDDDTYVQANPHVLGGLTRDNVKWAFTTSHAANWHPITWLSLMLDCQLLGPNPVRIHLVNVLLHLANALLLLAVLKQMTGSLWSSAFVAAAFALHPMHVESVAWITERKDLLCTFFLLLTLAAYTGYVKRPSILRYFAALLLLALGLMAKPMPVTLPFLLLLLDYWPLNRYEKTSMVHRLIIEKIPFFALAAVSGVITFLVQQSGGAMRGNETFGFKERIANAAFAYVQYVYKMFWPQKLSVFYPFDASNLFLWKFALCVLLLVGISIWVIRFGRTRKYLLVGWFWFVGTLIPVIGLVQVGLQAYADRYTYISYIGLFILLAWGLPQILPQRTIIAIAAGVALTAMGFCSYYQVDFWKNSLTLFSHAIAVTQKNYLAYNNLGAAYGNLGRYQDAVDTLKQATRIKPDYPDANYNLGSALNNLGRYNEAIEALKLSIQVRLDFADAHYNLGVAYNHLGRFEEAIAAFKQANALAPDEPDAYYNLAVAYNSLGRYPEAAQAFGQAIKIRPNDPEAHYNLAVAYNNFSRYEEAIEVLKKAITLRPDDVRLYNNLGTTYGKLGRYPQAIEALKKAIQIKPDYAGAHFNLCAAYHMTGQKDAALAEYNILKKLDPTMAERISERLK